MCKRIVHLLPIITVAALACPAPAGDWPCWRGPNRNGISAEKGWLDTWPAKGPVIAWKAQVGLGFSSVVVADGWLFTMGHKDDKDTLWCLDATTGKVRWSHSYKSDIGNLYFEGGPTSTPAIHQGLVYALGRWGEVFCFEAATGKERWAKNIVKDHEVRVPTWGFASSPTVHDNLLLLNAGKAGLALDRLTGKLLWSSDRDEEAGYSTPLPLRRGEEWFALFSSGNSYSAVNVKTGKEQWSIRWPTRYGVNSADPIVVGDQLFISSGYNKGSALFKLGPEKPAEIWRNKNLRNQMNPSVLIDGHLYGIDGDTVDAATLRCVELRSGEVRWTQEGIGSGALLAADGKLIVLSDQGELLVAKASPKGFSPSARARVLEGKCWTVPVLANGRIYCRSAAGELVCVDVTSPQR